MQNSLICPSCGTANRPGAHFCFHCRASLAGAVQSEAMPAGSPAPAQPVPAAGPSRVGAYPAPGARVPALSVGRQVTNGLGLVLARFGRILALGGRAAYADFVSPSVAASGKVVAISPAYPVGSPFEWGFVLWILAWLLGVLLLFIPEAWALGVFAALYILLLLLSSIPLRRPAFSMLTLDTIRSRLTRGVRGAQNQIQFQLESGQQIVMLGPVRVASFQLRTRLLTAEMAPQPGHYLHIWGTAMGKTLRAWKIEYLQLDGKTPAGLCLVAPRVIPLVAALFVPLTFWLVVRIVILLIWHA